MFPFKAELIWILLLTIAATSTFGNEATPSKKCYAPVICSVAERSQRDWQQVFPPIGCETSEQIPSRLKNKMATMQIEIDSMNLQLQETKKNISTLNSDIKDVNERQKPTLHGWYKAPNGYLYLIHSKPIDGGWQGARGFCQALGGDIAMVGMRDAKIEKFLVDNFVEGFESISYWIGLRDENKEGDWIWADGIQITEGYSNWASGEPNGARNENCCQLRYQYSFMWNDSICKLAGGVVCEKNQ